MPRIEYAAKRFSLASQKVIDQANDIIRDYDAQGYTLTLRQLYYQFVARDLSANTMKDYKRIGSIINDGRLAGLIDWEAIEDRTRNLESPSTWDSPADIVRTCAKQFKYDWWLKQPVRIEIWVEKEALVGVIERVANRYRVPYFACRGNVSQSELWRAGVRMKSYYEDHDQRVIVLHLGDHDPSGIDMTRDNIARLELFGEGAEIEVKRLALNFDQVKRYRPPPNPAKMTDSRAAGYVAKFGNQSWELDALSPKVIDELIQEAITNEIDGDAWDTSKKAEDKARAELQTIADRWKDED
jgi:hypothetical protein